jgi:hypothetical protein
VQGRSGTGKELGFLGQSVAKPWGRSECLVPSVPEMKTGKTRFHFDIFVADRSAPMDEIVAEVDAKVAELVGLGATVDHTGSESTRTLCGTPW